MSLLKSLSLTLLCAVATLGQAVTETAVGTAAAAAASSGASGAGQAVGGVFGSLTKALEKGAAPSEKPATIQAPAPTASPGKGPASKTIDASLVVAGLTRAEILKLGVAPTSTVQRTRRGSMIETLWFKTDDDDELEVQIVDGKVASAILASEKGARP